MTRHTILFSRKIERGQVRECKHWYFVHQDVLLIHRLLASAFFIMNFLLVGNRRPLVHTDFKTLEQANKIIINLVSESASLVVEALKILPLSIPLIGQEITLGTFHFELFLLHFRQVSLNQPALIPGFVHVHNHGTFVHNLFFTSAFANPGSGLYIPD
jgi:hypothetical protein